MKHNKVRKKRKARGGQGPIPGSEILSYLYNSNKPGTMTVIPRVDTAPHGVETPTKGTPLLNGVREASGPRPLGVRSSASSLTVIEYCTATTCC